MSEETFLILLETICDDITANYVKSRNATSGNDPIYPELVLASGLEFMGGCALKSMGCQLLLPKGSFVNFGMQRFTTLPSGLHCLTLGRK